MDKDEFYKKYPDIDLKPIFEIIINIIREVYHFNSERHIEEHDDGITFGVNNWRNIWNRIEIELPQSFPNVKCSRPNNSLQINIGDKVYIHLYSDSHKDLKTEPNTFKTSTYVKQGVAKVNYEQQALSGLVWEPFENDFFQTIAGLPQIVITHNGNINDGLVTMEVSTPVKITADEALSPWRFTIYSKLNTKVENDLIITPKNIDKPYDEIEVEDLEILTRNDHETKEVKEERFDDRSS